MKRERTRARAEARAPWTIDLHTTDGRQKVFKVVKQKKKELKDVHKLYKR